MPDITLAVSLAFLSFAIGYAIRGRKRKPDFQKQNDEKYLISKKVWLTIGIFIVLGYLSLLKFNANPLLGVQDIAMRHTAGGSIYTDTTGYFVIANILVGVAAIIIFALTGKVLPTLLVAGPWLLVRLYIGWSRNVIVTFVIALVSVFYIAKYNKKLRYKLSNILIMALLIIMVVVIMPIIQGNRFFFRQHEASSSNIASVLKQQLNNKGSSSDFIGGFDDTLYMLYTYPAHRNYLWCEDLVYRYFIAPIPRMLWPGKPLPWGYEGLYDPSRVGDVTGSVGWAYEQFGFVAIVFFFLLQGLITRSIDDGFWYSNRNPYFSALFGLALGYSVLFGRDSLWYLWTDWMLLYGLPIFIVYHFDHRIKAKSYRLAQHKFRLRENLRIGGH
ncbi:MAG: O-antigen polymerase [Desulfobaccales bacterium]